MEVVLTNELIRKIARAIRAVKPDIVLTHWERDYHLDHNTTSQAVTHAVLCACVPRYDPETEAWSPSRLYYSDTMSGLDFEPELWVDISETEEIKLKSFAAHKSQMAWLGRGGADPLEAIRIQDRFRGLQVGCMFAEAFRATKRRGFVHAESGSIRSLSSLL
ncbi:MAG: hypothetical protein FJ045_05490 [Crenarchaeota archaeon]|nr:hypothetical protein [Thermoproteota archaeon]